MVITSPIYPSSIMKEDNPATKNSLGSSLIDKGIFASKVFKFPKLK